jgi:predicted nucleic acid-binding protein
MNVLVDTSIWSLAFRKKQYSSSEKRIVDAFIKLLQNLNVVMIGPIRQEILSGISDDKKYKELRNRLSFFVDYPLITKDYEKASECFNKCRKYGIQGSHIDFLICACSINNSFHIFTLDKDFQNYKKHIPIFLL